MEQIIKIAFQGEPGAYSEAALLEHFGPLSNSLPCPSFDEVFESVNSGTADYGLVPIENSLAGSIHRNYDLLLQNNLFVIGEHFLPVRHCLIGFPGVEIHQLKKVISHPQALAQCEASIKRLKLVSEAVYDTAGSVKILQQSQDHTMAAIASSRAANIYKMSILLENIEDNSANITRFLVIHSKPITADPEKAESFKTSIVFALNNIPGALFKALSVFALRDIDLTKIESRPLAGKPWEYFFYVDFAGSSELDHCRRALDHLQEYATFFRILGSYPRSKFPGIHKMIDQK